MRLSSATLKWRDAVIEQVRLLLDAPNAIGTNRSIWMRLHPPGC